MPLQKLSPEARTELIRRLKAHYQGAKVELDHADAFQLLAATILSAQCTDERVNQVTPALFAKYPTPQTMAQAPISDLETLIHSTGFFRNKAKSLLGMSQALVSRFGNQVPRTMEELLTLPGVARKTANVVLGSVWGIAVGVVVDTHVMRLSQLLGLSQNDDPKRIEQDLMAILPQADWIFVGHALILHGRRVCIARRPQCNSCFLADLCPSAGANASPQPTQRAHTPNRASGKRRSARQP